MTIKELLAFTLIRSVASATANAGIANNDNSGAEREVKMSLDFFMILLATFVLKQSPSQTPVLLERASHQNI
jgi:hypothetical protein